LIVGWCGQFLFFVVPRQFSQGIGEWPENQILIPDWTYFHCPGATLLNNPGQICLDMVLEKKNKTKLKNPVWANLDGVI